ncbi:putative secreted protein [Psilocybe cubensis]|uniref:Secreted protein n=1 Tax=Psilocybe cubensis TaxID=181762 RepID=A0ACB8H2B2_PSICU|nr:putative secreted protein [Psilocybe cubensis]KAH9481340.1 putative secreted protein [Psilocybe cubensis]
MVKTTFTSIIALALGVTSVFSAPASSVAPPPDFAVFGINGSGCPPGSASYYIDDNAALNVVYSSFYAEAGPGIPISENRKNCQLTLGVRVPQGFSFALASTQVNGYYYLDQGVTAAQDTLYYFQGSLSQGNATHRVTGPIPGMGKAKLHASRASY